jgi:hypothetical protein
MCSDIEPQRQRWFAEWEELFGLPAAPRRQPYLNAGLVAFSADRWPGLLEHWWEASHAIPVERTLPAGARSTDPLCFGDQDVMNALLMTVVPRERVVGLPEEECPSPKLLPRVRVVDERRLACRIGERSPYLLHYWGGPKPWQPNAWVRVRRDAYVRLIPRLLYGADAPVPVAPHELPRWLRPGRLDRLQLFVLGAVNAFLRAFLDRLSHDSRNRVARLRKRLVG